MIIAGVDEAGRGPLVGAVVAAACILDSDHGIKGLTDSKKLSEKQREYLYAQIISQSLSYGIASCEAHEIDELNIHNATLLAMKRAVLKLEINPELVLVDGKFCPDVPFNCKAIIKGDLTEESISAASILAKVTRDRQLYKLDKIYPEYGFAKHKGYPTKAHLSAIEEFGIINEHRRSYKPVAIRQQYKDAG